MHATHRNIDIFHVLAESLPHQTTPSRARPQASPRRRATRPDLSIRAPAPSTPGIGPRFDDPGPPVRRRTSSHRSRPPWRSGAPPSRIRARSSPIPPRRRQRGTPPFGSRGRGVEPDNARARPDRAGRGPGRRWVTFGAPQRVKGGVLAGEASLDAIRRDPTLSAGKVAASALQCFRRELRHPADRSPGHLPCPRGERIRLFGAVAQGRQSAHCRKTAPGARPSAIPPRRTRTSVAFFARLRATSRSRPRSCTRQALRARCAAAGTRQWPPRRRAVRRRGSGWVRHCRLWPHPAAAGRGRERVVSLSSDGRPAARQGMQTPHRSAELSVDASSLAVSCGSRGVSCDIRPASLFGTRDSARCALSAATTGIAPRPREASRRDLGSRQTPDKLSGSAIDSALPRQSPGLGGIAPIRALLRMWRAVPCDASTACAAAVAARHWVVTSIPVTPSRRASAQPRRQRATG